MLNGNTVATLTFNQLHSGQQRTHDGSVFDQYYQYQQHREGASGGLRERHATRSTAASS